MRVLITGAAGSGTSTLSRALAQEIGARFIDADDYFWEASDPPFQTKREPVERLNSLLDELQRGPSAVVAGSIVGWGAKLEDGFSLIVFLSVPTEVRLARLKQRELERFGKLDEAFLEWAAQYDEGRLPGRCRAIHDEWLSKRACPKIQIEGEVPVREAVLRTVAALSNNSLERPREVGGPRLSAARSSWPAAQLKR
jgi:adenylate kinase family enzyme